MDAGELIERLGLEPHPEGGHYRRTWTGPPGAGGRAVGSAILYLLAEGERSHWHRIDASELWAFNTGAPLRLAISGEDGSVSQHLLGPDVRDGHDQQVTVPAKAWQSAEPTGAWTLVSCVVVPGFDFEHFELAPPGWSPG